MDQQSPVGEPEVRRPPAGGRAWLEVPYAEKDAAKAAGARWDPAERWWFAPAGVTQALAAWVPRAPIPELLPGEDRAFGGGQFIDPVPTSCWFTNARSCISGRDWDRVRRMVTARAQQRCEACGAPPDRDAGRWLEVHERWEYLLGPADVVGTQVLRRLTRGAAMMLGVAAAVRPGRRWAGLRLGTRVLGARARRRASLRELDASFAGSRTGADRSAARRGRRTR